MAPEKGVSYLYILKQFTFSVIMIISIKGNSVNFVICKMEVMIWIQAYHLQ